MRVIQQNIMVSIIGAILGAPIIYGIKKVFEIVVKALQKNKIVLLKEAAIRRKSEWYVYHVSCNREGQEVLIEYIWNIGIMKTIAIPVDKKLPEYHGRMTIYQDGMLSFSMQNTGSGEHYYVTIRNIIPNAENIYTGIKIGEDFQRNSYATIYLFSKNRLDIDMAKHIIKSSVNGSYIIKVK